jgi:hypothetical protein
MEQVSVRSVVSVSALTIVVNVWIQNFTVNSEPNVSSGRCQGIEGKKKLMECNAVTGTGTDTKYGNDHIILKDSTIGKPATSFH